MPAWPIYTIMGLIPFVVALQFWIAHRTRLREVDTKAAQGEFDLRTRVGANQNPDVRASIMEAEGYLMDWYWVNRAEERRAFRREAREGQKAADRKLKRAQKARLGGKP